MDSYNSNEEYFKEEYIDVEFVKEDVKENEEAKPEEEVANYGAILEDVFLSDAFLDVDEIIRMLNTRPEVPMDCVFGDGAGTSAPLNPAAAKQATDHAFDLTKEEEMNLEAKGYVLPIVRPFTKDVMKELILMRRKHKKMLASRRSRQKLNDHVNNLEILAQNLPIANNELKSTIKILETVNEQLLQDKSYLESIIAAENSS